MEGEEQTTPEVVETPGTVGGDVAGGDAPEGDAVVA